jgi:hypothetical protein
LELAADAVFLDLRTGRAILLKLFDDDDRESGSLNRDRFDGAGWAVFSCISLISYKPVSESASGAVLVISAKGKLAEPMKSFPDSLSLSITVNAIEYDCSCRRTWKIIFSPNIGLRLCLMILVRYTFFPKDAMTKGSTSNEVRVTY